MNIQKETLAVCHQTSISPKLTPFSLSQYCYCVIDLLENHFLKEFKEAEEQSINYSTMSRFEKFDASPSCDF